MIGNISGIEMIDVYDQLLNLSEEATGKRPTLFISSARDLEACLVMLSGEGSNEEKDFEFTQVRQVPSYRAKVKATN